MNKTLLKLGLIGAAIGQMGCAIFEEKPLPEPKPEDYRGMEIQQPFLLYPGNFHFEHEFRIVDEDGNGTADVIHGVGFSLPTRYVAAGYDSSRFYTENAITMSPEIREAATKALQANNDLSLIVSREEWKRDQAQRD